MKIRNLSNLLVSAAAGILLTMSALAQPYQLTGTNYFQNFDLIASGLPSGWNTYATASSTALGNLSAFHQPNTNWANTSALFWNYASITNNDGSLLASNASTATQYAVTNRVLGLRQTGTANTGGDPGAAFAFEVASTTNGSNFKVSFDWLLLSSQGRTTTWSLDYGIGNAPTLFTKIGTWTNGGFLPSQTNVTYFGTTNLAFSFGNALDNQTQPVWIRVVALSSTSGSGSRCTFGMDNFNLSWSPPVSVTNPVVIVTQPVGVTNGAGLTALFSVNAGSTTSPVYQWYEVLNGVTNQLFDGGSPSGDGSVIGGSTGPTLVISGAFGAESAGYFVNVSNPLNSTNSAVATLKVIDPVITAQPFSQTNVNGDITYFDITSVATQPVQLIWYYNGLPVLDSSTNAAAPTNQTFLYITNSAAWVNPAGFYLVASNMYGMATSTVATASLPSVPPGLITRWDFNDTGNYTAYAPLPSIGAGTAVPLTNGGFFTNFVFASGAIADPQFFNTGVLNEGWEFAAGPTNGTANKQVGFQYNVSTAGFSKIHLTWVERHSATASKYMRVQYSADGSSFSDGPVLSYSDVAYEFSSADLSGFSSLNNNPNFAFRIVPEFESTAIGTTNANYVGTSGTYGTGGTTRNDLMTVWGSPILNLNVIGSSVSLSWTAAGFNLQTATNVTGPYTNIPGATGPTFSQSYPDAQRYFRLYPSN